MRFLILALFCVMAGIAYIQRSAVSIPADAVAASLRLEDLGMSMGAVQSLWYLGYSLMQIPGGHLADRFGSRRTVAVLCVIWSAMTFLTGLSANYWQLTGFWFLMGCAQAGAFPCAAKAIGQIFPDSERARASGMLAAGMAVGGAVAPVLATEGLEALQPYATATRESWRLLLFAFALPGVLWSVIFLGCVPRRALPHTVQVRKEANDWSAILNSSTTWLLCLQQFFRAAAMVFFMTWFPLFLQKTRGVDLQLSGKLTSLAGIGGVVGSLTGGFVSDAILKATGHRRFARQGLAVIGMGLCSVLIVISWFIRDVTISVALISLGTFCATFGGVSGYTVAIEFGGRKVATVFSLMNMCGNIGATLFPITAGYLVSRTGNWDLMLFLFAVIIAVDAVCWAILNPPPEGVDGRSEEA